MSRLTISFFILFMIGTIMHAQKDSSAIYGAKNSFFVEFGGNGGSGYGGHISELFSLNYDRLLHVGKSVKTSVRVGNNIFQKGHGYSGYTSVHIIPIMLNLLVGKKQLLFEFGVGYQLIYFNSNYGSAYGALTTVLGLRYQNKTGIIGRIGFTPTIGTEKGQYLYFGPIGGISLGYSF